MSATCNHCSFWGKPRNRASMDGHLRSCACPKMNYGCYIQPDDVKPDECLIEDDEGWGMETGPDFGCIHFTESHS